jgi:hypothetical protein
VNFEQKEAETKHEYSEDQQNDNFQREIGVVFHVQSSSRDLVWKLMCGCRGVSRSAPSNVSGDLQ